jgi:5-hydroxyisourate hydrolase-like protein (transthyretin family)
MLRKIVVLAMVAFLPGQFACAQASKALSGHVFDAQSKRGIENLEVRLKPQINSTAPIMIGTTDQNGVFRFPDVRIGVYLVEVSQGPYVLYRNEVDISKSDNIEIPVQKR